MWVSPRAGASYLRHGKIDTGVVAWSAHGASANLAWCSCVVGSLGGNGCSRRPKDNNQTGLISRICVVVGTRPNDQQGERGKSMR